MVMSIIDIQNNLKNLSDQQLQQEMQTPTGSAPQFLVLSELNRREQMRASLMAQQGGSKSTVAQDVVAAAGIPQAPASAMAQSLAPKTDVANNTGIATLPQGAPQRMASGGIVRMYDGGSSKRAANPAAAKGSAVYTDPAVRAYTNRMGMSIDEYLNSLPPADRKIAIQQADARASRERHLGTEPDIYITDTTAVNPSYTESTASVFPPEPGPTRLPPGFERYGREGAPTMADRVGAANLPSFADMTTPAWERTGRTARPDLAARVAAQSAPTLDDILQADALARASGTNAVRPGFIAPNVPNYQQAIAALPGMDRAAAQRAELAAAAAGSRSGATTGTPPLRPGFEYNGRQGAPTLQDQLAALPGMDQSKANREELAAAVMGDRAGIQTALPRTPTEIENQRARGNTDAFTLPELLGSWWTSGEPSAARSNPHRPVTPLHPIVQSLAHPGQTTEVSARAQQAAAKTTEAAHAAQAQAAAGAAVAQTSGNGGSGGGGGGGGSSYEQELRDALVRTEKRASQDKWLALAQAGLALMSSPKGFAEALGDAGQVGIQGFQQARDNAEAERMKLQEGLYSLDVNRQRAAAAAARGGQKNMLPYANFQISMAKDNIDVAKSQLDSLDPTDMSNDNIMRMSNAKTDFANAIRNYQVLMSQFSGVPADQMGSATVDPTAE